MISKNFSTWLKDNWVRDSIEPPAISESVALMYLLRYLLGENYCKRLSRSSTLTQLVYATLCRYCKQFRKEIRSAHHNFRGTLLGTAQHDSSFSIAEPLHSTAMNSETLQRALTHENKIIEGYAIKVNGTTYMISGNGHLRHHFSGTTWELNAVMIQPDTIRSHVNIADVNGRKVFVDDVVIATLPGHPHVVGKIKKEIHTNGSIEYVLETNANYEYPLALIQKCEIIESGITKLQRS